MSILLMIKWQSKYKFKQDKYIFIPTAESLAIGKEIKKKCALSFSYPNFFYHLRKGGHVTAAKAHTGNKFFAKFDIENYFESISRGRITRCLKPIFGYETAVEFSHLSTVKKMNGSGTMLPFGFAQSQIIASICLQKSAIGKVLEILNRDTELKISVYVDDIIISSNNLDKIKYATNQFKNAVLISGFQLNPSKSQGPSSAINAFNLDISNHKVEVSKLRIQSFIENLATATKQQKRGILNYIDFVNSKQLDLFVN